MTGFYGGKEMGDYKIGRLAYQRAYKRRWRAVKKNHRHELAWRRAAYAANPSPDLARKKEANVRMRRAHFAGHDCCDICGKRKKLVIDHDHEFARKHCKHHSTRNCRKCRRGALCNGCNVTLNRLEKNRTSMLLYLDLWRRA